MASTGTFRKWNQDLSKAIAALGSDEFFASLIAAIGRHVKIDYPQVWLYHKELPPQCIYHEIPRAAQVAQFDLYLEDPYREDPFCRISLNQPRGHFYRLGDLIDGLPHGSYYQHYYGNTGTVDEVIFLSRPVGGSVINICLMRKAGHGVFEDHDCRFLRNLAPPVSALLRSHSQMADFTNRYLLEPDIDGVIDHAVTVFGSSLLSPREKSVLELMLRGYGSNTSAERLGIAKETLRRHRKSIYRKLDVNSQTDLFSLFINCLSYLGDAGSGDPLTVYMAPRAARRSVL